MRVSYFTGDFKNARKLDTVRENLLDEHYKLRFNEKVTEIEAKYSQEKVRQEEAIKTQTEIEKREKM